MPDLSETDLDRICTTTFTGRFGVSLIAATELRAIDRRQTAAGLTNHPRRAAVMTTARRGHEQGKL